MTTTLRKHEHRVAGGQTSTEKRDNVKIDLSLPRASTACWGTQAAASKTSAASFFFAEGLCRRSVWPNEQRSNTKRGGHFASEAQSVEDIPPAVATRFKGVGVSDELEGVVGESTQQRRFLQPPPCIR